MPAAKRLSKGVLVLSAFADREKEHFTLGQIAMRTAYLQGLKPIFPPAYCVAFMTQEELARKLREVTLWWYRRCTQVWLCLPRPSAPDLDALTHDMLLINSGLMAMPERGHGERYLDSTRLPVFRFYVSDDDTPTLDRLDREGVSQYLRCNLNTGMFRGLEE